jgi:hypothetical protein
MSAEVVSLETAKFRRGQRQRQRAIEAESNARLAMVYGRISGADRAVEEARRNNEAVAALPFIRSHRHNGFVCIDDHWCVNDGGQGGNGRGKGNNPERAREYARMFVEALREEGERWRRRGHCFDPSAYHFTQVVARMFVHEKAAARAGDSKKVLRLVKMREVFLREFAETLLQEQAGQP